MLTDLVWSIRSDYSQTDWMTQSVCSQEPARDEKNTRKGRLSFVSPLPDAGR